MLKTGSVTICVSFANVVIARLIRNGIVKTVTTRVMAESVTQSGTSARAANEYAFEVAPLGHAATITRPIAIAAGGLNRNASAKATSGSPTSCAARPI